MPSPWFVYVLRCADDTLYTGIATDLVRRLAEHNAGTGARYTRSRRPVALIYYECAANRAEASRRECAIKRLARPDKLALVGVGATTGSTHPDAEPQHAV